LSDNYNYVTGPVYPSVLADNIGLNGAAGKSNQQHRIHTEERFNTFNNVNLSSSV